MNMRALVVDDSKVGRLTMQKKLEAFGIGVDLAESGLEALSYLERRRPDMIFMDHMMPGLDGFEATRRIKSSPATRDIPVIIISGSDDEAFVRDARAVGADGAIAKPPTSEAIERILTTLPRPGTAPVEAATAAPPLPSASPTPPAAAPDQAALHAMLEEVLGQALERLRGELLEQIRPEWAAAFDLERREWHHWSEQIGQRLDALTAAQAEAMRTGAEAQAAQLARLESRLAALEEAARQPPAPIEAWYEGVDARLGPRLQEIGFQMEQQGMRMEEMRQALAGRLDALDARDDQAMQTLAGQVDALAGQVERLSSAAATQAAALGERIAALEQQQTALESAGHPPSLPETALQAAVERILEERLATFETRVVALDEALQRLQDQLQDLRQSHTALRTALADQSQLLRDDLEQRLAQLRGELAE
ncbi:MAG: response regulator, partial [Thiobacillaceae bacterium]